MYLSDVKNQWFPFFSKRPPWGPERRRSEQFPSLHAQLFVLQQQIVLQVMTRVSGAVVAMLSTLLQAPLCCDYIEAVTWKRNEGIF